MRSGDLGQLQTQRAQNLPEGCRSLRSSSRHTCQQGRTAWLLPSNALSHRGPDSGEPVELAPRAQLCCLALGVCLQEALPLGLHPTGCCRRECCVGEEGCLP